jgi:arylamine N-acetyltransferase
VREDAPFSVSLRRLSDGHWRYQEEGCEAPPFWFDFAETPADEDLLASKCLWQRTAPASTFVGRLVVQIRDGDRHLALRDKTLSISSRAGLEQREIDDFGEWTALLGGTFKVPLDPAPLWEIVTARAAAGC